MRFRFDGTKKPAKHNYGGSQQRFVVSIFALGLTLLLGACGSTAAVSDAPTASPTSPPIDAKAKLQAAADKMQNVKTMNLSYEVSLDLTNMLKSANPATETPDPNKPAPTADGGGSGSGLGGGMGGLGGLGSMIGGTVTITGTAKADVAQHASDSESHIHLGGNGAETSLVLAMRTIREKVWIKDIMTNQWESCPSPSSPKPTGTPGTDTGTGISGTGSMFCSVAGGLSYVFDPSIFVTATKKIENPKFLGVETINGVKVDHITGNLSADTFGKLGGAGASLGGTTDLWIGESDNYLYKIDMKGSASENNGTVTAATTEPSASGSLKITLSDFDKPVDIQPPQ